MDLVRSAAKAGLRKAKRYPVLYRLWYLLYRKNTGVHIKWFSATTRLYIDGYPRSGNTFAQHLIRNLWPSMDYVHHFHSIAPIKIALNRHIPTFVLFRYPAASISSNYLKSFALGGKSSTSQMKTDLGLLRELTKAYSDYYAFVSRNSDKLIDFDWLIRDPSGVMFSVNQEIPEHLRLRPNSINRSVDEIKDRDFGARDPLGSSKPSPYKEDAKKALIDAIAQFKEYGRCLELYESLKEASLAQEAKNGFRENSGDR